jgi:hypothetical protein
MRLTELQSLTLKRIFQDHNIRIIHLARLADISASNISAFLGGYAHLNNRASQKILELAETLDPITYLQSLQQLAASLKPQGEAANEPAAS